MSEEEEEDVSQEEDEVMDEDDIPVKTDNGFQHIYDLKFLHSHNI